MNRQQRRAEMKQNGILKPTASQALEGVFSAALQHHQAGRLNEAGRRYRQILVANPRHADSLHMLGVVEHRMGRFISAIDLISKAIKLNDGIAPYHFNLSRAFEEAGQLDEAVRCYRKTITLWPDNPDVYANLGNVLQELRRLEEAAVCFRKAIELEPGFAEAHTNLGNTLRDIGQLDEAVICSHRAIELAPNFPEAHSNFGVTLSRQGRMDEAIACYRRALGLQPDLPAAHNNLAMALLAQGDMDAGWEEYEWRWQMRQMRSGRRDFVQPQWQGEAAAGRTLLIHAEQGFGDTLQFCRYATQAAARGLRVIMEVQKPLVRLLSDLPGVDLVIGRGEKLPRFDLHAPLLSLPRAFGTRIDTIPGAAPYLHANEALAADWQRRLAAMGGQGRRIGLVWAGSPALTADRQRSIPPERLAPLFELTGLTFFSMQKSGPAAPADFPLLDFMEEMDDFASTAALIVNLDLVISVDTAVAHLAAALGKPVWTMNRFDACWRWLIGRRDSPWYPTLRIYRQPRPDDWASIVTDIARDLKS
jgi:tetratricopeptide (TPR) repeat protein